ncbi:MAG: response regulator, partial [bacterium]
MIRLFVIEDHPVIVTGLRNLFRPSRDGIEVAGSASGLAEALLKATPTGLDIFILDLWLGRSKPVENVRTLRAGFPGKPIVVYTSEISSAWRRKVRKRVMPDREISRATVPTSRAPKKP